MKRSSNVTIIYMIDRYPSAGRGCAGVAEEGVSGGRNPPIAGCTTVQLTGGGRGFGGVSMRLEMGLVKRNTKRLGLEGLL